MSAQYWVFVWENYYPSGGMNDFKAAFDKVAEASAFLRGSLQGDGLKSGHVWDISADKEIEQISGEWEGCR